MKRTTSIPSHRLFLLLLVASLALAGSAHAQDPLFTPAAEARLTPRQARLLQAVRERPTTVSVRLVRVQSGLVNRQALAFNLTDEGRFTVTKQRLRQRGEHDYTWVGTLEGREEPVLLTVNGEDVTGMIHTHEAVYTIEPLGDGLHALIRLDQSAFPPDEPPGFGQQEEGGAAPGAAAEESGAMAPMSVLSDPVIDILVVYTQAAANASGNINSVIDGSIDATNETLINSWVPASVNKVHQSQVTYSPESGDAWTDVTRLQNPADSYMDNVHSLRTQYGADVVVLIVANLNACGIARQIEASSNYAFAVVRWDCAVGNYTFAHEVGHLVGARHDEQCDSNNSPYPHGHGYRYTPANWRTVMACQSSLNRIPYWSNPDKSYGGVAMGTTQTNDNVRVWENRAATVAGFYAPPNPNPPPPAPQNLTITNAGQNHQNVQLSWSASSGATSYSVWRGVNIYVWGDNFTEIGTTSSTSYTDSWVTIQSSGDEYYYYVKAVNSNGTSGASNTVSTYGMTPMSEGQIESLPEVYALESAYPNPLKEQAVLRYALPEASEVRLIVFDALGREIARLVEDARAAGYGEAVFEVKQLPPGMYVAQFEAKGQETGTRYATTQKLVVLR